MCRFESRLWLCGVLGFLCAVSARPVPAQEKPIEKRPATQVRIPLQRLQPAVKVNAAAEEGDTYEMDARQQPLNFQVVKVDEKGEVELKIAAPPGRVEGIPQPTLTEGWFLGLAVAEPTKGLQGARVVRVKISDVLDEGQARAEVGAAAAGKLKVGETVLLFRPARANTAKLKRLPDIAPLEESNQKGGVVAESQLVQSRNNLKQIGLAMHNYHDTFGAFPPAVVNGPDGKPWHSWRVLLLPYLDAAEVYNQYRFDEPWDGPNNRKLLSKMPKVYSDPIHGENKEFYTHYVVPTGDDTIFSSEGSDMSEKDDKRFMGAGPGIRTVLDGTSNTILAFPATPDQKIPWMKPEDFEVGISIPDAGKEDSIPTPYQIGERKGAPVLFADGSVRTLTDGVTGEALLTLLTRAGGEVIDNSAFEGNGGNPESGPPTPLIKIIRNGAETKAVLELRR